MVTIKKIDRFFEKIGMEWTYVLWSPHYPWRAKIGRSTQFDARIRDIQATMRAESGKRVRILPFVKMPMFWAGKSEKAIHGCILWRPAKNMPGSGYTEWSEVLNFYSAALSYILLWGFGGPLWVSILIFFAPIPFDFGVITIILAFIQYAFVGFLGYAVWTTFFG